MRASRLLLPLLVAAAVLAALAASESPLIGAAFGILLIGAMVALRMPLERIAFLLTCLFLLTVTWNGLRLGGGALTNGFMALALVAGAAYAVLERRPVPLPAWMAGAGAGFAFVGIAQLIFPADPALVNAAVIEQRNVANEAGLIGLLYERSDIVTLPKIELALILIPVLIAIVGSTQQKIERLLDMFLISATVCAGVAVLDFGGFHQLAAAPLLNGTRSYGLTIHPNYLALTCAIAIPLACLWINRGGRWQTAGLISVFTLLGGVYVSGSRAGTVAAVLALVASVALLPRLRRALGFVAPVAGMGLIVVLLSTSVGEEVIDQVRLGSDNYDAKGSDLVRDRAYDLGIDQFTAHPIHGSGLAVIQDAHNIYVQLLAAGGVIALASFLVFIGGVLGAARRAMGGPGRDTAVACAIAIVVWLANGVYDSQLVDKYLYVIPGLLVAMSYATARATAREPARAPAPDAAPQPPALAGAPT